MLNSVHQKTNYMRTLGLVEPVQYNLGSINMKQATFQYVPLIDNLQAFVKNNDVFDFIMIDQRSICSNVYKGIQDGITLKKKKYFQIFPKFKFCYILMN